MVDGFQLFHIPQQSRRDKLRILSQNNPNSDQNLLTCISNNNSNLNQVSCSSSLVNFTGTYDTTSNNNSGLINTSTINPSASSSSYNSQLPQPYPAATLIPNSSTLFDQSFNGGDMVNLKSTGSLPSPTSSSLNHKHHHDISMLGHGLSLSLSNTQKTHYYQQNLLPTSVRPFAGYALILKGSRFLKPAKQLLEEFCDVTSSSWSNFVEEDSCIMDSSEVDTFDSSDEHHHWWKTKLISILDELNNLAPTVGTSHKGVPNYTQVQDFGMDEHHVCRPQRGLPQRAVVVLRTWLFEHFLHPYPTDMDKQTLVSNWFINARVRLWKPMVEEVHTLETRQDLIHQLKAKIGW
ncbi:hypothetical protein MKW94_013306 [Papaver nudicaule]|uniref:Uncharacterized protein n=1 Tax=Papaver nudicaule TaxID=74823 RepID=A0AA41S2Y7_PAPNU|nr:hypothetical protein [Papaver nudicaule]